MIGVIIVVLAITTQARVQSSRTNETYRRMAAQYGGRCSPGGWFGRPSLRFVRNGAYVLVDIYSTGGKHPRYYTQLHVSWPDPHLRLEVFPEGIWSRVGRFFGMEDIQIGSRLFDEQYIIRGSDHQEVRAFLSEGVQWQIDKIRRLFGNNDVFVQVARGSLLIKKLSLIRRFEPLQEFLELSLELYEQALLTQHKGIEFVEEVIAEPLGETICQICGEDIQAEMVYCRRCKTPHHRDCWQYYGACSTYGCQETRHIVPKIARRAAAPVSSRGKQRR